MSVPPSDAEARATQVVPYSEVHREAHEQFADRMWPGRRRRRDDRYLRWKFRGPSTGPVEGLLIAVRDGRVIGQLGLIPVDVRVPSGSYPCRWACDLMVDPAARRQGVSTRLFSAAIAGGRITFGSNPTAGSHATMNKLGFGELRGPRIMVLPLNLEQMLQWKMPPALNRLIPLAAWLARPIVWIRFSSLARPVRQPVVHECAWQEVVAPIAERQRALDTPHIVHDREFLQWRCGGLPGFEKPPQALRTDAGGYAIVRAANPLFAVFEWGARDRAEFVALFHRIYKMARQAGTMTIEAFAQDEREEEWLQEVGFLGLRHRYELRCYSPEPLFAAGERFHYCLYDSDGYL